jgi:hypothetical protein
MNYMPHVGRMDGETPERLWSGLNQTSGSTSEKSPGFRWDSINYQLNDWNYEKMVRMGASLLQYLVGPLFWSDINSGSLFFS